MLISLDSPNGQWQIKSYSPGKIQINDNTYINNIFLIPQELISPWPITDIANIKIEDIPKLHPIKPDIILLGTGSSLIIPPAQFIQWCSEHHIGLEYINTKAACRTYNALAAEGRKVFAGFIV